jgi:hypothetical protein
MAVSRRQEGKRARAGEWRAATGSRDLRRDAVWRTETPRQRRRSAKKKGEIMAFTASMGEVMIGLGSAGIVPQAVPVPGGHVLVLGLLAALAVSGSAMLLLCARPGRRLRELFEHRRGDPLEDTVLTPADTGRRFAARCRATVAQRPWTVRLPPDGSGWVH